MTGNSDDFLRCINEQQKSIFERTLSEQSDAGRRAMATEVISDFSMCISKIESRIEKEVFELSIKEYQYSLYAICHGGYRQAFSSLRLALELWLAGISFSACEKDLRAWKRKRFDIAWSKLINDDSGVLSKNFVSLFSEILESSAPTFRTMSEKLYRECSEYVHGNHHTHTTLPETLRYDQEIFRDWCAKVETFKIVCLFCFAFRYTEEVKNHGLANSGNPIGDTIGYMPEIRSMGA